MELLETQFEQVKLLRPKVFKDDRGYFFECFRQAAYTEIGLPTFVQDNVSYSSQGVVRGLHYQLNPAQGKLVTVLSGEIYDVAVDIRQQSATFGQWVGYHLSEANHHQLYIPDGFAHGFAVLSKTARVYYKCTNYYEPKSEFGLAWDDPELAIDWQVENAILSSKDQAHPTLTNCLSEHLPT